MDDEIKKVDETQPEEENKSAISADLIRSEERRVGKECM